MTSTIRAASNFSSTNSWSPASMLLSVANALMWYIGASTRMRCGRVTGMNASAIGVPIIGLNTRGRCRRGSPSACRSSRCCRCRCCSATPASGSSGTGSSAVARDPRQVVGADVDLRVDHLLEAFELPVGHVPPHRDRHRAELPRRQHAEDELGRVADAQADAVAEPDAPRGERRRDLARSSVAARTRSTERLGAVHRQVHVRDLVAAAAPRAARIRWTLLGASSSFIGCPPVDFPNLTSTLL